MESCSPEHGQPDDVLARERAESGIAELMKHTQEQATDLEMSPVPTLEVTIPALAEDNASQEFDRKRPEPTKNNTNHILDTLKKHTSAWLSMGTIRFTKHYISPNRLEDTVMFVQDAIDSFWKWRVDLQAPSDPTERAWLKDFYSLLVNHTKALLEETCLQSGFPQPIRFDERLFDYIIFGTLCGADILNLWRGKEAQLSNCPNNMAVGKYDGRRVCWLLTCFDATMNASGVHAFSATFYNMMERYSNEQTLQKKGEKSQWEWFELIDLIARELSVSTDRYAKPHGTLSLESHKKHHHTEAKGTEIETTRHLAYGTSEGALDIEVETKTSKYQAKEPVADEPEEMDVDVTPNLIDDLNVAKRPRCESDQELDELTEEEYQQSDNEVRKSTGRLPAAQTQRSDEVVKNIHHGATKKMRIMRSNEPEKTNNGRYGAFFGVLRDKKKAKDIHSKIVSVETNVAPEAQGTAPVPNTSKRSIFGQRPAHSQPKSTPFEINMMPQTQSSAPVSSAMKQPIHSERQTHYQPHIGKYVVYSPSRQKPVHGYRYFYTGYYDEEIILDNGYLLPQTQAYQHSHSIGTLGQMTDACYQVSHSVNATGATQKGPTHNGTNRRTNTYSGSSITREYLRDTVGGMNAPSLQALPGKQTVSNAHKHAV